MYLYLLPSFLCQRIVLNKCSVNFSFNETGKILCSGKTKNRCQSYNAVNMKEETALSLLFHVSYALHFTVTCFDFARAVGTAIRKSEKAFYMLDSRTCRRSYLIAGHFLLLKSLFSFSFAYSTLCWFSSNLTVCLFRSLRGFFLSMALILRTQEFNLRFLFPFIIYFLGGMIATDDFHYFPYTRRW